MQYNQLHCKHAGAIWVQYSHDDIICYMQANIYVYIAADNRSTTGKKHNWQADSRSTIGPRQTQTIILSD